MENQEILDFFEKLIGNKPYLEIPEEILSKMSVEHGIIIRDHLKGTQFFKLPLSEIHFFEWLREADPQVWDDLWLTEDLTEEPYIVGILYVPLLLEKDGRGFPICDLLNNDNYYFSMDCMQDEESKIFIESARERFINKEDLTIPQLLALEISMSPIDIWHFAYKHGITLSDAKQAVDIMVEDGTLVHLKESENLSHFIKF